MAPSTTKTRRGTRAGWRSRIFGWALRGREVLPPEGKQWPIGSAGPLAGCQNVTTQTIGSAGPLVGCHNASGPAVLNSGCQKCHHADYRVVDKKKGAIGIKWSKELVRSESGDDGGDTPRYYAQWLPRYGDSARPSLTSSNKETTQLWLKILAEAHS